MVVNYASSSLIYNCNSVYSTGHCFNTFYMIMCRSFFSIDNILQKVIRIYRLAQYPLVANTMPRQLTKQKDIFHRKSFIFIHFLPMSNFGFICCLYFHSHTETNSRPKMNPKWEWNGRLSYPSNSRPKCHYISSNPNLPYPNFGTFNYNSRFQVT